MRNGTYLLWLQLPGRSEEGQECLCVRLFRKAFSSYSWGFTATLICFAAGPEFVLQTSKVWRLVTLDSSKQPRLTINNGRYIYSISKTHQVHVDVHELLQLFDRNTPPDSALALRENTWRGQSFMVPTFNTAETWNQHPVVMRLKASCSIWAVFLAGNQTREEKLRMDRRAHSHCVSSGFKGWML